MEDHKTLNITQYKVVHVKRGRYRQTSPSDTLDVKVKQSLYRPVQTLKVPDG